jgi:hypothetical protein
MKRSIAVALALIAFLPLDAVAQPADMTFFVTGGPGPNGANFGGIEGADRFCQQLAGAAGAGQRTWRAYLSATASGNAPAINARDRIGRGPWRNAKGVVIAKDIDDLHADPNINKATALTETGEQVSGRGDTPNMHDILTGSQADGRAFPPGEDRTCGNWTRGGDGIAVVGHHDRLGLRDDAPSKSWNSSHVTRGCSLDLLKTTGGDGRLYCFAID